MDIEGKVGTLNWVEDADEVETVEVLLVVMLGVTGESARVLLDVDEAVVESVDVLVDIIEPVVDNVDVLVAIVEAGVVDDLEVPVGTVFWLLDV